MLQKNKDLKEKILKRKKSNVLPQEAREEKQVKNKAEKKLVLKSGIEINRI